jgi:PAS domain S-box-containing protein
MPVMDEELKSASGDDQLFLGAFNASPIGIALEDLEGRPLFVNPALCSMLGFSEEEMRSKHCVEFSPPEDAQKDWALFEQLRAGSIDRYQLEKRFFRRDGSVVRGRLSISLLGSGKSQLVVATVEDLSEKKTAQDELQSETNVENLGGCLIQAQEEERTRIARELRHYIDRLTLLSIYLDRFQQNPPESVVEVRQEIGEARQQLRNIVSDILDLSHRLYPSKLEYLGLAAAAASFCRELSERQKVEIDFHCAGILKEMPKQISLCLYRVLQEALQNAAKHSRSRLFEVLLSVEANEIQLTVRDSGLGFDPAVAMTGRGLGLISMKRRLELVDGEFSIESQPQHGTTIHARVPLKA